MAGWSRASRTPSRAILTACPPTHAMTAVTVKPAVTVAVTTVTAVTSVTQRARVARTAGLARSLCGRRDR
jgi:hypothetical protein